VMGSSNFVLSVDDTFVLELSREPPLFMQIIGDVRSHRSEETIVLR
jgi:hypothetical protein